MQALDLAAFESRANEAEARLASLEAALKTKSGESLGSHRLSICFHPDQRGTEFSGVSGSQASSSELESLKETLLRAREATSKLYEERDAAMNEASKLRYQNFHLKQALVEGDQKLKFKDEALKPIEAASALVHQEWMKRNPKEEWNAAQHVPYEKLPEKEKQKDRDHVFTVLSLLASSPGASKEVVVDSFAALAHEHWRKSLAASGHLGPRMKKAGDGSDVDINVEWTVLHPDWKKENLAAGSAAYDAVHSTIGAL